MRVAHLAKKRQCDIIFGIILLFIIDIALAAPIPEQEKRQTCAYVPGNLITLLNKRGDDDLVEKLTAYFGKWADPPASSNSPLSESEHEPMGDAQTSISPPLGSEHESTSDAQTSSSPLPVLEHEQVSGPASATASSITNPNSLVESPKPLSTEPSTYTSVSSGPSSYTSTEYGSDDDSARTHVPQPELYPPEWDFWLDSQNHADQEDHMHQLDSSPTQQQNGFALGSDVQRSPPLDSHQNGFAHGQMDDAAPPGSNNVPTGNPQALDAILAAHNEWLNNNEAGNEFFHVYHVGPPSPPRPYVYGTQMDDVQQPPSLQEHDVSHEIQVYDVQQQPSLSQDSGVPHGTRMNGVVPTDHARRTPSTVHGWDYGSPGTHESQPDLTPAGWDYL